MYGEFKTLAAQESDWMERLEKKLRKSVNSAADAEEISEELDDIENFLNNHPDDRIKKLVELANDLEGRQILIGSLGKEAEKLKKRWKELESKARKRTQTLEGELAFYRNILRDTNERNGTTFVFRLHRGGPGLGVQADRGARLAGQPGHPTDVAPGAGADRRRPAGRVTGKTAECRSFVVLHAEISRHPEVCP